MCRGDNFLFASLITLCFALIPSIFLFAENEPLEPPRSSEASVIDRRTFDGVIAELVDKEEKKPAIEKPPEVKRP